MNKEIIGKRGNYFKTIKQRVLYFDLLTRPKMPFQGDGPEGGDTF